MAANITFVLLLAAVALALVLCANGTSAKSVDDVSHCSSAKRFLTVDSHS